MSRDALASCLMVTLPVPRRLPYFRASVADYCRQSWPPRELVVVMDDGDPATRAAMVGHLASLGRDDIRVVDGPGTGSLGALRNASIGNARGEFVCQWDDDDRHHPERLAAQIEALQRHALAAVCLEEVFQFVEETRSLHLVSFRATRERSLPGTLLALRAAAPRYPEDGISANKGEDSAGLRHLSARAAVAAIAGMPHLYVYVSHGANIWGPEHHRMIAERLSVSRASVRMHERAWRDGLAAFAFEPGIAVRGRDGEAFELHARDPTPSG